MSRNNVWTEEEDEKLVSAYPKGLVVCQSEFPYRSIPSILYRAKRLGLSRAGNKHWTGREEMKLRMLWHSGSRAEIEHQIPGKSWEAITSKAGKLDLEPRLMSVRRPVHNHNPDPILQAIADRMKERNFTLAELGEVAGTGRNVTSPWLSNKSQPKLIHIRKVIEALDGELIVKWHDAV